jgi:hypothetical protein
MHFDKYLHLLGTSSLEISPKGFTPTVIKRVYFFSPDLKALTGSFRCI